jgi:hypothetical protein
MFSKGTNLDGKGQYPQPGTGPFELRHLWGTKSEVTRRFIEEGIRKALNDGRIAKRDIKNYGGPAPSED